MLVLPYGGFDSPRGSTGAGWLGPGPRRRMAGFAGAFRRSELVGLDVGDLDFNGAGLIVNIRRSKTDQEGQGRRVGIPYGSTPVTCPVRALEAWLAVLGADEGPLFRGVNRHGQLAGSRLTAQSVALVIKRLAGQAGMEAHDLAGHSLRAGLATEWKRTI